MEATQAMQQSRSKTVRRAARSVTRVGAVVMLAAWLVAGVAGTARALDPGDGATVSSQQLRQPIRGSDRVVTLEKPPRGGGADKAELSVYQVFAMYFGTLVDNDGYVVLGTADNIAADPNHLVYGGSPISAEIRLQGDAFRAVAVNFTGGGGSGFAISDFATDYGVPPLSGLTLDATGYLTLRVGARLDLDAAIVGTGAGQQVGYTVSAVYE